MDPAPAPTPDPTTFFIDFKNTKTNIFSYFFLITFPQAHYLWTKKFNFLLKFCVKILFSRHYFSLNTFMRKGKDLEPYPEPDPDPYLCLMDPDPDPGEPKTCGSCGSGSGSGSPTLQIIMCVL
jgi:hypothetical protein